MIRLRCPHCTARFTKYQPVNSPRATLQPGDVIVCWECVQPGVCHTTGYGLTLTAPTDAEWTAIRANPAMRATLTACATHPYSVAEALTEARTGGGPR